MSIISILFHPIIYIINIETRLSSANSNNFSKTNTVNISNTLSLHIPKQTMNKISSISNSIIENKNITQEYSHKNIKYNIIDSPYLNETIVNIIINKSGYQRLTIFGNSNNLNP